MRNFFAAFARNLVFANVLLAIMILVGYLATQNMIRETFPDFSLDVLSVTVPWPGADPEEIEEGISRKIEEAIEGIEGIKQYNTISAENMASAIIEVAEDYDVNYVKERVRNAIEAISTFPEEAEKPIIEEILLRSEVLFVSIHGAGLSERLLKEWSEDMKEEIRALPGISQVQVIGARQYEIGIEVSEERLREYGLSFAQVADAVRRSNLNLSGGNIRTQGEEIRLRTMGRKYTGEELSRIVVLARPGGDIITLDRIATIRDDFTQDRIVSRFNGEPAITIAVLKTQEEDAIAIATTVRDYIELKRQQLPPEMHLAVWADLTGMLRSRINLLTENGLIGLTLVFVLLWLFLDVRLSFWAGMGMPISVAGALGLMWVFGATINMISLFGLIMVLGIVVDDAIVVGEAIYVARKNGAPPLKAAIDGVSEVGMPVIAALTTTIVAFIPLLFVGGIMGKFIAILPVVVIACLAISLVECLFMLPAHLAHLPDPNDKRPHPWRIIRLTNRLHRTTNEGMEWFAAHVYAPFLGQVLKWRYISASAGIALFLFTFGLIEGGFVKFVVFPRIDSDDVMATIEFLDGTPIEVTEAAVVELEEAFKRVAARTTTLTGEPLIRNMYSVTGSTMGGNGERPVSGNNLGAVRVELLPAQDRGAYSEELAALWEQEAGVFPGMVALTIGAREAGPPGAPIEIWVQGHRIEDILAAADELKEKLASYDGVYQIQHDFRPGKSELRFELKPEARGLGLTVADLARQVYAGYFGEEAIRLQRGRDDIRVRVRYPEEERSKVAGLEQVRIRTPQGHEVPLMSVATVHYSPGYATINRTDGMRRANVTAEVDPAKANANEIFNDLNLSFFASLESRYPGVRVSQQGEKKKMAESLGSLLITYPIALLGMFVILATIFRSYIQPMLIMVAVPFGFIGAVFGHMLLRYDLSMMSMFGIVALSGVVVNDAIVLIECFNENIASGMKFLDALKSAGRRRFRAIFLTTATTVGGLAPLIMETDMQAVFMIPMAISLAAGVAFSTLITLVLIPCLLVILNDLRQLAYWMAKKEWPLPEQVEPARIRRQNTLAEAEAEHAAALAARASAGAAL